MANALYEHGRENFLLGAIAYVADDIVLMFIDEGIEVPDLANDEDLADRAGGAIIDTSGNFAGKTATSGVADANDITLATVVGAQFESIDIYMDSGVAGTSWLICNIDTATGLPCTPNGGDIIVQWDAGADKIFKL